MTQHAGRHRAPARRPSAEIARLVSGASSPAVKGGAVLLASGGLVAAIAVPASATGDEPEAPQAAAATAAPARAEAAVTAPARGGSSTAAKGSSVASSFGAIDVEAVAEPQGPTPWQLEQRRIREAAREQDRREAAAEAERREAAASESASESGETADEAAGSTGSTGSSAAPRASADADRSGSSASRSSARTPSPSAGSSGSAAAGADSSVIAIAKQYTGVPYLYGGSTPAGFDCSGFTQYVFAKAGTSLPRVTTAQQAATTPVSDPQPGDLVFFGSPAYHVGIYVGDGQMIDAPRTGSSISVRPVFDGVSGYGRV